VRVTLDNDRQFPAALSAAMAVQFDYDDGDGVDFEPFEEFLSAEETTSWFRAWTGNATLNGDGFRIFGQDGTGGYAAFWLVRQDQALVDQPVAFLGSEGETSVIARDLGDFLWLLADGLGPCEAADPRERERASRPNQVLAAIAEGFAPGRRRSAVAVIASADQEFPGFDDLIMELCQEPELTKQAADVKRSDPAPFAQTANEDEQQTLPLSF
jgi:hypothetical protein